MADTLNREEAIRAIRAAILGMVDEEHSMCQIAAERGIFCHGFRQDTHEQLKERYDWLAKRRPDASREELEDMANRWQLARQVVLKVPLSCDAQTSDRDSCGGWDDFDNKTLERFYLEILGKEVTVTGD